MANLDTRELAEELEGLEDEMPHCPNCGGDHLSPPFGPRIWKCLSCHFAFDEPDMKDSEEDAERATAIRELLEEVDPDGDGETLISEDDFEEHARELAEEIGAIPDEIHWPFTCIDWKQAASDLQTDYSTVTFDGTDYYYVFGSLS